VSLLFEINKKLSNSHVKILFLLQIKITDKMSTFALSFKGSNHLKQKLILATISGKAIKITDIRKGQESGIQEFEISLIRLIDKLTNGTKIRLSPSGNEIEFTPGILNGGKIDHSCCVDKSIGKF
jgi:RNA 3'-terminal phosphate cyclase-like protein